MHLPRLTAHITGINRCGRYRRLCHHLMRCRRCWGRFGVIAIDAATEARLGHVRIPAQYAVLLLFKVGLARLRRHGHSLAIVTIRDVIEYLQWRLRMLLSAMSQSKSQNVQINQTPNQRDLNQPKKSANDRFSWGEQLLSSVRIVKVLRKSNLYLINCIFLNFKHDAAPYCITIWTIYIQLQIYLSI